MTSYKKAERIGESERASRIAAIIGESKAQQFLDLERNIREYREVQSLRAMFKESGAPLTNSQRNDFLGILIATQNKFNEIPHAGVGLSNIE